MGCWELTWRSGRGIIIGVLTELQRREKQHPCRHRDLYRICEPGFVRRYLWAGVRNSIGWKTSLKIVSGVILWSRNT